MSDFVLKKENWFWCDLCMCISYLYECECHATSCNCGGCEKCRPLHELVKIAEDNGNHPTEEECKANSLKRWGSKDSPETKLLDEIFGIYDAKGNLTGKAKMISQDCIQVDRIDNK